MCTILLAWRCLAEAPVVLAANRDELLARPSAGPSLLVEHPPIAGGRDLLAGGTWLAVSADGRVAALTNRRVETRDPSRRSRGEIPVLLLTAGGDAGAGSALSTLDAGAYNPFNALYVSASTALSAHGRGPGPVELVELPPGPHVLTVHDTDDRDQAKVAFLLDRLAEAVALSAPATALLEAMERLLTDHGGNGRGALDSACVHADGYGTVSSSSVLVPAEGPVVYRHAPGRPCQTPHSDVSAILSPRPSGTPRTR